MSGPRVGPRCRFDMTEATFAWANTDASVEVSVYYPEGSSDRVEVSVALGRLPAREVFPGAGTATFPRHSHRHGYRHTFGHSHI